MGTNSVNIVISYDTHSGSLRTLPAIVAGGKTWISKKIGVTGTNLQFYLYLEQQGNPSASFWTAVLFQEHNITPGTPQTGPFDLSIAPVPDSYLSTDPATIEIVNSGESGEGQTFNDQNIGNGGYIFY